MLKLYNTLTRKKELFKPIRKNFVGMYGCGPTVYWYQHIGNIRRYVFEDILKRILLFNNYNVKHIINVTDVGHLTSDADEGEDKIEKAAKKERKTAKEISRHYFDAFKNDLTKLNFTMPDKWTWATEYIGEQIELVKKLEEKGYTYKTSDGIYFDTSKLKDYGKLARLNIKGLKKAKRIKFGGKKNKTDFALWKFSEKPGVRQQEWNSPWGVGFPGWHIECSAMSIKELGEQFDIHTGGIDHIPVHHTNEIAQSESATGKKPWVNYWLHSNHLILEKGKMSKSSGDILTLSELERKRFKPLEFKYLCLLTHYKKKLIFSEKKLSSAKNAYQRLKNIILELKEDKKHHRRTPKNFRKKFLQGANKEYLKEFETAINDDLNTPRALQVLWKLVRDEKAVGKIQTIKKMDEVFGLDLLKKEKIKIPDDVKKLVKEREDARKKRDFKKADELRNKIKKLGFSVEDVGGGSKIKKL
ncbi:cysteine--tRNA ligase [Candidatus Pacearchaeota archaeon]|nr:cysteine--tRNA ligase [Candidatus Pacearchaeota archaeon]